VRRSATALALLALFAAPAVAQAAPRIEMDVTPAAGVLMGDSHTIAGVVADGDRALANQAVILEARRYPFTDEFKALETASTDRQGRFEFERELDRNHDLRVVAPAVKAQSRTVRTYTFPRTRLTYDSPRRNVVRITMRYTVPEDVELTASTRFYVGRRSAKTAPFRSAARTRRTSPGHFLARTSIRIPADYRGRFRFATCFRSSGGMGDPRATCPRRSYRFGRTG
jgi:hypothetical protein